MGVQSAATTGASRNRIGACTRGPASSADLAVRVDRGRNHYFLVLTGMPRPVLGESCTTSIKDFAIQAYLTLSCLTLFREITNMVSIRYGDEGFQMCEKKCITFPDFQQPLCMKNNPPEQKKIF